MLSIFTLEIPYFIGHIHIIVLLPASVVSVKVYCTSCDVNLVRNALELLLPLNVIYTLATYIISALQLRLSSLINDSQLDLHP